MSEIVRSVGVLEMVVRGVALKPQPESKQLLDTTMRVLAEEERLESMLRKAEARNGEKIKEALEKVKEMKRTLLRVYFSSMLLGEFKREYFPAIASLGERKHGYHYRK
jgi:hypothetical protein